MSLTMAEMSVNLTGCTSFPIMMVEQPVEETTFSFIVISIHGMDHVCKANVWLPSYRIANICVNFYDKLYSTCSDIVFFVLMNSAYEWAIYKLYATKLSPRFRQIFILTNEVSDRIRPVDYSSVLATLVNDNACITHKASGYYGFYVRFGLSCYLIVISGMTNNKTNGRTRSSYPHSKNTRYI